MKLEALEWSFKRYMRAEGRSVRTIETHSQGPTHYRRWLASEGLPETLESLTRVNIRDWLAVLSESNLSVSTIRIRHAGMKQFCLFLLDEEIDKDPMKGIKPPAIPIVPVPIIEQADLSALVKACTGTRPMLDRRDEAIIRILLDTGCRASELIGMTLESVDLDQDLIMVRGKGNKVRPLYLSAKTARSVDRYIRLRANSKHAGKPDLWLGMRGPLTYHGIRELLKYRASLAGVDYARPHRFRHSAVDDLLKNGAGERDVMRLMGWTSTTMLARYGASQADERAKTTARRLSRGDRV